jgi:hypothetical protein
MTFKVSLEATPSHAIPMSVSPPIYTGRNIKACPALNFISLSHFPDSFIVFLETVSYLLNLTFSFLGLSHDAAETVNLTL